MPHHHLSHDCPYCNKTCYGPHRLEALEGFPIICAHCGGQFSSEANEMPDNTAEQSPTDCPIICPNCQITMQVSQEEYEALIGHRLACPDCDKNLTLPDMPPLAPLPSAFGLLVKLGFLYLLILASLALLFTPQGADFINDLAQISDRPADHLTEFQRRWHNIWHHFLGRLQGLFL
jgi:hypothetical protein